MAREAALLRAEQTDKTKELILLVCELEDDADLFGQVKLNKILFNIDFKAYAKRGESVTGQEYQAQREGPTLRRMLPLLREMLADGDLAIKREPAGDYTQERPVALRAADLGVFDADELELINSEAEDAKGKTAAEMADMSHEFLGWRVAAIGETIPYGTVFAMETEPLTEEEREFGRALAQGAG
jgi:hypothetical protein